MRLLWTRLRSTRSYSQRNKDSARTGNPALEARVDSNFKCRRLCSYYDASGKVEYSRFSIDGDMTRSLARQIVRRIIKSILRETNSRHFQAQFLSRSTQIGKQQLPLTPRIHTVTQPLGSLLTLRFRRTSLWLRLQPRLTAIRSSSFNLTVSLPDKSASGGRLSSF